MSYCRFSDVPSDPSDVYVWADVSGCWRTEVAGRKRKFLVPVPPEPSAEESAADDMAWIKWYYREFMPIMRDENNYEWEHLPPPSEGHSFAHATPGECADSLERLREEGLTVPQYAIDSLRDDD